MNKILKIILITLSIPVILIVIFFVQDYARFAYDSYQGDKQEQMTIDYMAEQERLAQEMNEAYKQDFDGGETPQETWRLFVTALEAGDTDLASKYFIVEKQEEWKENISLVKKGGNLPLMIEDISNNYKELGHTKAKDFRYVKKDKGIVVAELILVLNPYTNTWKIKDL